MEWKWTKGEPYERSMRYKYETQPLKNEESQHFNEIEKSAYTSSLNHDENTWEILNQTLAENGFKNSNKREDLDSKIAGRELVQQIGYNPFLSQNSYANDISISNQFLKPVSTSQDRITDTN
jgi:hypothetical protein